jgi:hypothetical protein
MGVRKTGARKPECSLRSAEYLETTTVVSIVQDIQGNVSTHFRSPSPILHDPYLSFYMRKPTGIIEGLLGKMASAIGAVEDLVVEYGEVECETETDGVSSVSEVFVAYPLPKCSSDGVCALDLNVYVFVYAFSSSCQPVNWHYLARD